MEIWLQFFLTLGIDAGSQLQATGIEHLHPLDRRLGGPSYSARGTEKESILSLLATEPRSFGRTSLILLKSLMQVQVC